MVDEDTKLQGHTYYWGSLIAGLLVWPLFFISITGLRGTIFDIHNSAMNSHIYMGLVFVIFILILMSLIAGCLVLQKAYRRFWVFHAFAVVILLANFFAALFNFWMVSCVGYGQGCI